MTNIIKKFEHYFEVLTFMVLMPIAFWEVLTFMVLMPIAFASPFFLLIWWAIAITF